MVERPPTTNQKQTSTIFLLTAAILVTSALTVGLTAPQQAEAKKAYCFNAFALDDPGSGIQPYCSATKEDCESFRQELIESESVIVHSECYKSDIKIKNNQ